MIVMCRTEKDNEECTRVMLLHDITMVVMRRTEKDDKECNHVIVVSHDITMIVMCVAIRIPYVASLYKSTSA